MGVTGMRDHGGDLDRAIQKYGTGDWLDLSTGINSRPYPVPDIPMRAWSALPTSTDRQTLETAAARNYNTSANVVALAGAQAAIQLVPRLRQPGHACIIGPTYNEHAAALRAQGWRVTVIGHPSEGVGADLVTVVNPNNPDGRHWRPEELLDLREHVGLLVVDESFADTEAGISLAPFIDINEQKIIVLRSFGKFYGLAGLRLGFALTGTHFADCLRNLAGPWAVSGQAIAIGQRALADTNWQKETRDRLHKEAQRLDELAHKSGWTLVGGTALFRTYDTPNAVQAQEKLARNHVWSRIFPYSENWLRLGLPGTETGWAQLERALMDS